MSNIANRVRCVYGNEPANVSIKARNLFFIALAVAFATAVMSVSHLLRGAPANLLTSIPAFVLSLATIVAVLRGGYRTAATIFVAVLSFTPLVTMLAQEIVGYRDIYLFAYFGLPILAISMVIGYRKAQLHLSALIVYGTGALWTVLVLADYPGVDAGDLANSAFFVTMFFLVAFVALNVAVRVEQRIMAILVSGERAATERVDRLTALLSEAEHTLSQGDQLRSVAETMLEGAEQITGQVGDIVGRIAELRAGLDEVASHQSELTTARDAVTNGMQEQSSAVEESSAAVVEMSASIRSLSDSAQERGRALERLGEQSLQTDRTFEQTLGAFESLHSSSAELLEVTGVIEDISARTSLLAMNAAIEAAHAGSSGRGFAVVADEVRKLASETSENSRTIRGILTRNAENIQEALTVGRTTRTQFSAIRKELTSFTEALNELVNGMLEMSGGTTEITDAVDNIRSVQQRVADSVESMRAALGKSENSLSSIHGKAREIESLSAGIKSHSEEIEASSRTLAHVGVEHRDRLVRLKAQVDELDESGATRRGNEQEAERTGTSERAEG